MKVTNRVQAQKVTTLVSKVGTTSTGALVDSTTALGINDGEVALLSADLSAADYGELTATPDGTVVQFVQGTPKSANTQNVDLFGVSDPAIVKSNLIRKDKVRATKETSYNSGTASASLYVPSTTIAVNSSYGIILELDGHRQERRYGYNTDQPKATVDTPAALPTSGMDYVLVKAADKLNSQSILVNGSKNYVVLGIDISGGNGTAVSTIGSGVSVNFMVKNGITYNMTATNPIVRALDSLIADSTLALTSTIEVMDVTNAGEDTVDALLVIGLDAQEGAYFDDVKDIRTDVTINPSEDFESEGAITKVYPIEAVNDGRKVWLANRNRAQLQIHTQQMLPYMDFFSEGYNYVDKSKNYGSYVVEFYDTDPTITTTTVSEKAAIVLWEQTENTPTLAQINDGGSPVPLATSDATTKPAAIAQFETWVNA